MKDRKGRHFDLLGTLDFGEVCLSVDQKNFYDGLNTAILSVIQSLPQSVQIDALLALARHLEIPYEKKCDFFKGFYAPSWSILYWIAVSLGARAEFSLKDTYPYQAVHAIAMLLHLWDDHLNDGDLPASHLTILIRSQMWMMFKQTLDKLVHGSERDAIFVRRCLDRYYKSIENSNPMASLDAYCEQFKQQMSLGYIAPVLLSRRMTPDVDLVNRVRSALGSFGCAWRLLDDLHDVPCDIQSNTKSAVHVCLSDGAKRLWNRWAPGQHLDNSRDNAITRAIEAESIVERIAGRICAELDAGTTHAAAARLEGYADELQVLAAPLRKRP